jgi:hypothetical protein
MSSPCRRCGSTKTDQVYHGTLYRLASVFGYRLRQCSRCRALRFLPRHNGKSPDSSQSGKEPANAPELAGERGDLRTAEASPEPKKDQGTAADFSERGLRRCPACGSTEYHRTKRTRLERFRLRPAMARCENCGLRFPYPGRREKYLETLKSAGAAATVPRSTEERKAPKMAEENTQPKVTKQLTTPDSSDRKLRRCPACGSTEYHRTKRTTLERLRMRPPMARCEKCGIRFLYPGRREKHPEALKLGGAVATVPGSAEERRAPGMAEESSVGKVTQQVTVVNTSNRGLGRCPFCGSTSYRRSRRSALEHLLLRPKMARCRHCRHRFPYPKR